MADQEIKLSDALVKAATEQAQATGQTVEQVIETWVRLGQTAENHLTGAQVKKLLESNREQ